MEVNNGIKFSRTTDLPTLNIKSQLNLNIDSNTHIKQVLNIDTCLFDVQIETMSNKAIVKGNIGVKVVYIDTDNMFNSISDTINFTETINNNVINTDCQISINGSQFITEFENDDKYLHIDIDGSIDLFCCVSSNTNLFSPSENDLIVKKSVLQTNSCVQKLNKITNYEYDFKLEEKINKMLSYDSKIIIEETKCHDGYILISGQIINYIIYEIDSDNNSCIKIKNNSTPFKCEVEATSSDEQCVADVSTYVNLNSTQITTDINDNYTQFNFDYCIVVNGNIYKNINIDVVEDVYSLSNSIDIISNEYVLCKKLPYFKSIENIDNEITLSDELNIDEILGMVTTNCNVTQHTIKDNSVVIEGVINGNLIYLDENREVKNLPTQLPYSIHVKQEIDDEVCGFHASVIPIACKCKIKRGNTLIIDYELCATGTIYTQTNVRLIDNIKYNKVLDYGDISFQIYIAKPNETCWDLCKRLHITQEQLILFNKETPETYSGGEKIIVYR